jgi:membrane protein DedA with SNARE-associated domain
LEEFLRSWGHLGIFLGIVATGVGFPMPEELPVVVGGIVAAHGLVYWWTMLPVCIVAVIIGDSFLYGIGRLWGPRVLQNGWVKKHLLSPERLTGIENNFHQYGIRILLFARMTPGIRAPIFLTAGIIRLPLPRFVLADGLYAVPGVSLLFFLGYYFGEGIVDLVQRAEKVKFWIMLVVVAGVALYFAYRFLLKPMVTGDPKEMPPIVGQVTNKIEQMTSKTFHTITGTPAPDPDAGEGKRPCAEDAPTTPSEETSESTSPRS